VRRETGYTGVVVRATEEDERAAWGRARVMAEASGRARGNRGPVSGASPSGRGGKAMTNDERVKMTTMTGVTTTKGSKRATTTTTTTKARSELDEFLGDVAAPVELTHAGRLLDTVDLSLLNSFAVPRMSSFSFQSLGSQSIVENELATAATDAIFDVFTTEMYARGSAPYTNTSTVPNAGNVSDVHNTSVNDVFASEAFDGFTDQMFNGAREDGIPGFNAGDYQVPQAPLGGVVDGAHRRWNDQQMQAGIPVVYQQQISQHIARKQQLQQQRQVDWNPVEMEWYQSDLGLDVPETFENAPKNGRKKNVKAVNSPSRPGAKRARTSDSKMGSSKGQANKTTSGARKTTMAVPKRLSKPASGALNMQGVSAQNFASVSGSLSGSTSTRFRVPSGTKPPTGAKRQNATNAAATANYASVDECNATLAELQKVISTLRPATRENIRCSLMRLAESTQVRENDDNEIMPVTDKDQNLIDRSVANVLYHRYSDISPTSTPNPEGKGKRRVKESDSNSSRDSKDGFFELTKQQLLS